MDDDDTGASDAHTDVDDEDGDADGAADGYGHGDTDDGVGNDAGDVMSQAFLIYERFGDTNLAHCWQSPAAWTWLGPEHTPVFLKYFHSMLTCLFLYTLLCYYASIPDLSVV